MKHVYCIPGLASDERVFSKINFGDATVHHLSWKIPKGHETLEEYAAMLAADIRHERPVLMGLSFGGIMAVEINKIIPVEQVILLASIKTEYEKPFYFRLSAALGLHKLLPARPPVFMDRFRNYHLGVNSKEQNHLITGYRRHANPQYVKWAIDRIIHWKNRYVPENLVHLHGDRDHIFPIKYVHADHVIKDGGHLFLMNNWEETNAVLREYLLERS